MNFFATSAQIANDFGLTHDEVIKVIENLDYPGFIADQIQIFDLGPTKIAQVGESGYNAIVLNLPLGTGGDDDLIAKWKETFLSNKGPSIQSLMNPIIQKNQSTTVNPAKITYTSEVIRKQAEEMISSGSCDNIISESYATIHRELRDRLGEDPGYQNVRAYAIARRSTLGLK